MNIRAQDVRDIPHLRRVYLDSRRASFGWMDTSKLDLADFDQDTSGELVLVAEDNGRIQGFSSSWVPDRFIHHLYVDPPFMGSGVGSLLLEATVRSLGVPVRLKCLCLNQSALRFYMRRGWQVSGQGTADDENYYELEYVRGA
jgi:GNAT superfamily N-acetyltransferase